MSACDVVIVGAGPYGLSAAAHLRAADGLDVRVFGEPMSFWERHMPKGMLLRSPLEGSQPFRSGRGRCHWKPMRRPRGTRSPRRSRSTASPIMGVGFQNHVAPDLDSRKIDRVEKNGIWVPSGTPRRRKI